MNQNAIALAAAVTAATAADVIRRFRKTDTSENSAQTNLTLDQINTILAAEIKRLTKINEMLAHQNDYMSGLIDQHDVPVTEFDRIAMTYPNTTEK